MTVHQGQSSDKGLLDLSQIKGDAETTTGIKAGVYGAIAMCCELFKWWSNDNPGEWWEDTKEHMPPLNSWLGSSTIVVRTVPSHVTPVGGSASLAAAAAFLSLCTGTPVTPGVAMTGGVSSLECHAVCE